MDERSAPPDESLPQGFACPGLFWLPGVLAIPALHLGVLALVVWRAAEVGVAWPLAVVAAGALAAFWVAFLSVARWLGGSVALNLLGLAAGVLAWGGLAALVVWWLVGGARG